MIRKTFGFLNVVARQIGDFLYGYDYFISYRQGDGREYPRGLADRLSREGFRVFLDQREYVAGDDLRRATKRRVGMSSYLLVVARPGALCKSEWVRRELKVSIAANRTPILIDVDLAFEKATCTTSEEQERIKDIRELMLERLRIVEITGGLEGEIYDGRPSDNVIDELKRSFARTRQDTRRARSFGVALLLFVILAAAASVFALLATHARREAERETRRSRSGQLATQSRLIRDRYAQLAVLLAAESVAETRSQGEGQTAEATQALTEATTNISGRGFGDGTEGLTALALSSDGRTLVTGGQQNTVSVWEFSDAKPRLARQIRNAGTLNVKRILLARGNRWMVATGDGGTGCLWHPDTAGAGACVPLATDGHVFYDPVVSRDGNFLAAPENSNTVWLWDLSSVQPPVGRVIGSHLYTARYAEFSPDNRWLAAHGISSRDVWVWDRRAWPTQSGLRVLRGQPSDIAKLTFGPANVLATGDDRGFVCIWRLDKGEPNCETLIRGSERSSLVALRFSDDGTWLAAIDQVRTHAGTQTTVIVWRRSSGGRFVQTGRLVFDRELRDLGFAPNGTILYLEGTNGFASLYLLMGHRRTDLKGHTATITKHAFARNGAWLFTGDNSGQVNAWDLSCHEDSPRPIALRGHEAAIEDLQLTPDERFLVSISDDGTGRTWTLRVPASDDRTVIARPCGADLTAAAISDDGRWLASGSSSGEIFLAESDATDPVETRQMLSTGASKAKIDELWFSPGGKYLIASDDNGELFRWGVGKEGTAGTRTQISDHRTRRPLPSISIAFTTDGRRMVTADNSGNALSWECSGAVCQKKLTLSAVDRKVTSVLISADNRWLAGTGYDVIWVWPLTSSGVGPPTALQHTSFVTQMSFSGDSRRLISIDSDTKIRLWNLPLTKPIPWAEIGAYDHNPSDMWSSRDGNWIVALGTTGPHVKVFRSEKDGVKTVVPMNAAAASGTATIADDGSWIAVSANNILQLWRSSALDSPPWVIQSASQITKLSFSSDHQELIAGSYGGDVGLFELAGNGLNPFANLQSHKGSVQFVAFSGNGDRAFSQSYEQLRYWDLRVDALMRAAAASVGRNISEQEWQSYFPGEKYRKTFQVIGGAEGQKGK